jgi:RHS repeat-associated protein
MGDASTGSAQGFGLMYYNARWYDPYITHFSQPDSIIPPGVQGYDRYAYANNSPIMHNDPTGHCPICLVAAVVIIGMIVLAADTPQVTAPAANGNASSVSDLIQLGLEHAPHANITGEGLQSLQDDPSVKAEQSNIVGAITHDPKYGEQSFSVQSSFPKQFTANGPSGNWLQAGLTNNQAFWMVHSGTISATNTQVSADGTISTTWHIHDNFDFIPGPDRSATYNSWASIVHLIYNDLLGAEETYPTDAYWNETIPPKKKSTPQ